MGNRKQVSAVCALAFCVLAGCGPFTAPSRQSNKDAPSALVDAAAAWMRFDAELIRLTAANSPETGIEPARDALRRFERDMDRFTGSGAYRYYQRRTETTGAWTYNPLPAEYQTIVALPGHITGFLADLREALEQRDFDRAVESAVCIRGDLGTLLQFDLLMGNSGAGSLFWLFITLLVMVTVMAVFLCIAYVQLKKARGEEEALREFSRIFMRGQETERRRIALDLHDSVLQDLRGITGAAAVSEKIRSICTELLPPDFNTLSFADSLALLCASFGKRTGIACHITIDEPLVTAPLDAVMQLHCYRMVEESLTNIGKHAGARTAIVVARNTTRDGQPHLLICVSDDGQGLDPAVPAGFGLRSMRERSNMLGASLDFQSEPGEGLMVRIEAPLYV